MTASLQHGASQQTALLQPRCTSAPNHSSSSCCTGCNVEATVILEATAGKAKPDMATSGHGRRQPDELWHPYRLAEGSWPREIASRRGHSNAAAGVGYGEKKKIRAFFSLLVQWLSVDMAVLPKPCINVPVFLQADFPSVAGLIEDLDYQLDADDISGQGHKEKKYYIDTVNIKTPRKGMEMTGFLRDGMSKCCS